MRSTAARKTARNGHESAATADAVIVVIGASAGGLEPISRLLAAMPVDGGLAYVVIQHLDPSSKSMLPQLLAGQTAMTVQAASDGIRPLPNQVYVIPPGADLSMASGRLRLTQRSGAGEAHLPIDKFLHSLAAIGAPRGVGVILSGTGADGALGLKALKAAGGLTLIQDPAEAQQDGMPVNAIQIAAPDQILRVADMPAAILRYGARPHVKPSRAAAKTEMPPASNDVVLESIVGILRSTTSQDFGRYKAGTLQRRIERRMALHGVSDWADYLVMLRQDPAESAALAQDLLINVTRFFRDSEVFSALAERIPELLHGAETDRPTRIWVAGCSTGEEAYSLAILFLERLAQTRKGSLQLFATDIDDDALQVGRGGVYPESIETDVGPERLARFFTKVDGHFKVVKELRDAVIFSRHDVLGDSPFSRLDLLSCRNLLIYLTPEAQSQVLALAHFALRENGLLLLGAAESAALAPGLFEPVDEKLRIFRRCSGPRSARLRFSRFGQGQAQAALGQAAPLAARTTALPELVQRAMLETYAPAAVLTNRQFVPLHYFGAADRYLGVVSGEPNQDVLSMARDGLRPKLRETIERALRAKRPVSTHGVRFERRGKSATVTLEAQRITDEAEDLVLVSFIDEPPSAPIIRGDPGTAIDTSQLVELRQQLVETRRELNRTIHDLREANDALRIKHEEAQSLNEEFLSTNEELESSKEELQSLNEELTTVNNQLNQALTQQQQTSTDLENLLYSSAVATIMLDADLCIKIFNPRMKALFSLIDGDIGRPLADLAPQFADPQLLTDATKARSSGTSSEREIRAESGAWFVRTVLPYRTESGEIQGAVVTFADVSGLKRAELESGAARRYAESVVNAIDHPFAVLDAAGAITSGNAAFCTVFDLAPDQITGRALRELGRPLLADARLLALAARVGTQPVAIDHIELEAGPTDGARHIWCATARGVQASPGDQPLILLTFEDVTDDPAVVQRQLQTGIDAKEGEARLHEAREDAERANLAKSRFLAAASHDLRQPLQTISLLQGYLEKRLPEPADAPTFTKLNAAVAQMAGLLDILLDINQIESGAIQPDITEFPIGELLAQSASDSAVLAAEKNLELRLVPSTAIVRSDRRLLARMIGNLLSNAIKYTDQGRILLGCRRAKDTLRIEVWDTGVGIPVADRKQIFEEFYRVDRTDGTKLGLGLGLSIVQRFAHLLGHTVEVDSMSRRGSAFTIVIADPTFPPTSQRTKRRNGRADASPPLVLLVEDDPVQLDAMRTLLELEGYVVKAVRRGDEALDRLRAAPPLRPDFIVADYNLPGGHTGLDVIQQARAASKTQIPALIVSGERHGAAMSAIDKAGVSVITKPVKTANLLAAAAALAMTVKPGWQHKPTPPPPGPRPTGASATIAVIDDESGVSEAIRMMLETDGHAAALYSSAEAFLSDSRHSQYLCLVVDLNLPEMSGLELLNRLRKDRSTVPIILITGRGDLALAVQAMREGAADFLQKPVDGAALNASVSKALRRSQEAARSTTENANIAARFATLSDREREVMAKVAAGMMNKNIAAALGISQRTAEHHRQNVMHKMGATSLAKLVMMVGSTEKSG